MRKGNKGSGDRNRENHSFSWPVKKPEITFNQQKVYNRIHEILLSKNPVLAKEFEMKYNVLLSERRIATDHPDQVESRKAHDRIQPIKDELLVFLRKNGIFTDGSWL